MLFRSLERELVELKKRYKKLEEKYDEVTSHRDTLLRTVSQLKDQYSLRKNECNFLMEMGESYRLQVENQRGLITHISDSYNKMQDIAYSFMKAKHFPTGNTG